ncbi:hypothetical protein [Niallia endozanthoxylica]|uniref:Uncharacterized protein n=1 Tax=Niallia endozanthoxylica TaxID=2036016 RepID=A0A5J5H212_9BACI|nr:hypothetical protein [Niallia endozanthoxylica]KAA9014561.1 hypothetical protein F4V44_23750 [Niallia endozanthoxylica]
MVSLKKYNVFRKTIVILAILFLISNIVFPMKSKADIVKDPDVGYLDAFRPGTSNPYAIVIEFDKLIQFSSGRIGPLPSSTTYGPFTEIKLIHAGNEVPIRLVISDNKLLIYPDPASSASSGDLLWGENKDYELTITGPIVENIDSSYAFGTPNPSYIFRISTYSLTFEELMSGSRKINTIIKDYTPRKINVLSPKRYIDVIDIIHKRQDLVQGSTTESVTNIDVTINHGSPANRLIKRIEVTPKKNGADLQITKVIDNLHLQSLSGNKLYDFGFTRLPDTSGFDFEVLVYDINDNLLDKRIVKVPYEQSTTTIIKQRDRYTTAGKTYTLYDLLKTPTNLQKLLDENRMDEITVQVVQE